MLEEPEEEIIEGDTLECAICFIVIAVIIVIVAKLF